MSRSSVRIWQVAPMREKRRLKTKVPTKELARLRGLLFLVDSTCGRIVISERGHLYRIWQVAANHLPPKHETTLYRRCTVATKRVSQNPEPPCHQIPWCHGHSTANSHQITWYVIMPVMSSKPFILYENKAILGSIHDWKITPFTICATLWL